MSPIPTVWPSIREFLDVPSGLTGRGVAIAIIDANFPDHPDIASDEVRHTYRVRLSPEVAEPEQIVADHAGPWTRGAHGLWAAAAAAGSGYLSHGQYAGMAPQANLYLISAYAPDNPNQFALEEAVQWVRDHGLELGIRGILVSFNTRPHSPLLPWQLDANKVLCEQLADMGILVVSGTGNAADATAVSVQASVPSVLSVGGIVIPANGMLKDALSYRGSRGTTFQGKWVPEILAPAENLVLPWGDPQMLSEHPHTAIDDLPEGYGRIDGTSFSGPIVLGAAACIWQAHPEWTNEQVKWALVNGSLKSDRWADLRAGVVSVQASVSGFDSQLEMSPSPFSRWRALCSMPAEERLQMTGRTNDGSRVEVILSLDAPFSQSGLQLLSDSFADMSPIIRSAALCKTALGEYDLDEVYLSSALQDVDARVRSAALYHILYRAIPRGSYSDAVSDRFVDEDPDVSLLAIQLAGMTKSRVFVPALVAGLRAEVLADRDIHFWGRIIALREATNQSFTPCPPFQAVGHEDGNTYRKKCLNVSEQWEEWLTSGFY
ncbi:MAG: S8 family serine peptidase [Sulfobacillus sp.]